MSRAIQEANRQKLLHALDALEASLENLPVYDEVKKYSYSELEVFDALTSRYIRAYETSIAFFRSYDINNSIRPADSLRDLLHNMEQAGFITDAERWLDMRLIRNKITHDYLPEEVAGFYALIRGPFAADLKWLKEKIA
jgi:hypothetical protein